MGSPEPPAGASQPPPGASEPPAGGSAAPAAGARFELHIVLIAAVASAAVACLGSRLGIAGTVAGAALAALLVAIGSAAVAPLRDGTGHWWQRIRPERLARLPVAGIAVVLGTAALALAAGIGLLSIAESIIGKPLSSVGRSSPYASGTTIGVVTGGGEKGAGRPRTPPGDLGRPPGGGGQTTPAQPPPGGTTPAAPSGGEPPPT